MLASQNCTDKFPYLEVENPRFSATIESSALEFRMHSAISGKSLVTNGITSGKPQTCFPQQLDKKSESHQVKNFVSAKCSAKVLHLFLHVSAHFTPRSTKMQFCSSESQGAMFIICDSKCLIDNPHWQTAITYDVAKCSRFAIVIQTFFPVMQSFFPFWITMPCRNSKWMT